MISVISVPMSVTVAMNILGSSVPYETRSTFDAITPPTSQRERVESEGLRAKGGEPSDAILLIGPFRLRKHRLVSMSEHDR